MQKSIFVPTKIGNKIVIINVSLWRILNFYYLAYFMFGKRRKSFVFDALNDLVVAIHHTNDEETINLLENRIKKIEKLFPDVGQEFEEKSETDELERLKYALNLVVSDVHVNEHPSKRAKNAISIIEKMDANLFQLTFVNEERRRQLHEAINECKIRLQHYIVLQENER